MSISERAVVITPRYLKDLIIDRGYFSRACFMDKREVLDIAFGKIEDFNILGYASRKGLKGFNATKNQLETLRMLKDKRPASTIVTIDNLFTNRDEAKKFLIFDDLGKKQLLDSPIYVIGYSKESAPDLYEALDKIRSASAAAPEKIQTIDPFSPSPIFNHTSLLNRKVSQITVFPKARTELLFAMSHLFDLIHKKGDEIKLSDICILCPRIYNNYLAMLEPVYGLKFNLPLTKSRNIAAIQKAIESYVNNLDAQPISDLDSNNSHNPAVAKLQEAVSQVEYALANSLIDPSRDKDLIKDYLKAKISNISIAQNGTNAITVVNSFSAVPYKKNLLILGFSSNLVQPVKDKDLIPDGLKAEATYQSDSVTKNISNRNDIEAILSLAPDLYLSRAKSDSFTSFVPVYFLGSCSFLKETPWCESKAKYNAYGIKDANSTPADLKIIASLGDDLYQRTRITSHLATEAISIRKELHDNFGSYNPEFSSDDQTVSYLKKYFDPSKEDKKITLSYSSIDNYYKNPFLYYCQNVLQLRSDNLNSLEGSFLHLAAEERDEFDEKASIESILKDITFPQDGHGRDEYEFFMKRALKDYENNVKPVLLDAEKQVGFHLIHPDNDSDGTKRDEFSAKVELIPDKFYFTLKTDAIYSIEGKDLEGKAAIIDFKKTTNTSQKVNAKQSLMGNTMQLPYYILFYNELSKSKDNTQLSNLNYPFGAFIVSLQSDNFSRANSTKNIFTGYSLMNQIQDDSIKSVSADGKRNDMVWAAKKESLKKDIESQYASLKNGYGPKPDELFKETGCSQDYQDIIKKAYLQLNEIIGYLQNGGPITSPITKNKIWFPYFPYDPSGSSDNDSHEDTFQDISFDLTGLKRRNDILTDAEYNQKQIDDDDDDDDSED